MRGINLIAFEIGAGRREHLQGKEYMVVPSVMLVSGVHNGKLMEVDEFGRFPGAWNGRPVTLGHPTIGGLRVSAGRTDVPVFGRVFNSKVDGEKLIGELWLDVSKMEADSDGAEILDRMSAGQVTDVSVAFWDDSEPVAGLHQGERYESISHNQRPDHVAILLRERGACSVHDGCGAPRAFVADSQELLSCLCDGLGEGEAPQDGVEALIRSSARRPSFNGTETSAWSAPNLRAYIAAYNRRRNASIDPGTQVGDLPGGVKSFIAGHTLLGEAGADNLRDLAFFPVVNPRTGRLNRRALVAVRGGRGAQANIPAAARESARQRAGSLLNSQFGADVELSADGPSMAAAIRAGLSEFFSGLIGREDNMEKLIEQILAEESLDFERADLEEMSEAALKTLAAAGERITALEDAAEGHTGSGSAEEAGGGPTGVGLGEGEEIDGETGEGEGDEEVPAWAADLVAKIDGIEAVVGELVTASEDDAETARQAQIASILDGGSAFSRTELETFSAEQLELIAQKGPAAAPVDFSGQGGARPNGRGEEIELPAF